MKLLNETHIEGILYNHNLVLKTAGENSKNPGTQYISGTIDIATDKAMTNIVQVHFTYETPTFAKSGQTNSRYTTLFNIINGVTKCYMNLKDGETAATIKVDSQLALNEFYSNRSGQDELVSVKRNEGGFIHINVPLNDDEDKRNTFRCSILITGFRRIEADEDRNIEEHGVIKGYVFDFRNVPMPMEFNVYKPGAIDYFENAEISERNPLFTEIRGNQITQTVVTQITEASAFGDAYVREVNNSRKEFIVSWALPEPYLWDDESTMTVAQLKEGLATRELALANMRQRNADYQASKAAPAAKSAFDTTPKATGFNF